MGNAQEEQRGGRQANVRERARVAGLAIGVCLAFRVAGISRQSQPAVAQASCPCHTPTPHILWHALRALQVAANPNAESACGCGSSFAAKI